MRGIASDFDYLRVYLSLRFYHLLRKAKIFSSPDVLQYKTCNNFRELEEVHDRKYFHDIQPKTNPQK